MATQLFVRVNAANIGSALVRSLTDMTPVSFPKLVLGDGRDYELYFVDGQGGYAAFSGNGGYIPYIAIGSCGYPSGGTAGWTFDGDSTAALAYNISPAALQTALRALASVGGANVNVDGVAGKYYTITFVGTLGGSTQPEITVDFSGLLPASTVEISTIVAGSASPVTNCVQLATLALNPITFADDWTPITNGWTGQLSTRTIEVIEAFVAAGGTITDTFQITIGDPLGVRTTYLKVDASIECTIINPEAFAGADKPLLATQAALNAAVLGANNFSREALSSSATGNTNVSRSSTSRHHTAIVTVTGTAGTRTLSILTTNSPNPGDTILLVINSDVVSGYIIEVRNATSSGTLLETITPTDSGQSFFVLLNWTGSVWQLDFTSFGFLPKKDNLTGLSDVIAARTNLRTLCSRVASVQTTNFTITPDDDGTYYPINTAGGAILATLPAASDVESGFMVAIQKVDSSNQIVTTNPATATLANAGQVIFLLSDATQWIVVMQYDPALNTPTLSQVVLNWNTITALTGGSSVTLDGQPTANGVQPTYSLVALTYGSPRVTYLWQLLPGTDAPSDTVVRPTDYNASTNAQFWKLVLSGLSSSNNGYAAVSNSTGDTTISRTASNNVQIVNVTGTARTSVMILGLTDGIEGDVVKLRLNLPTTASIIIEVRDATNSGTLLYSITTDGSGDDAYVETYFDGAAWQKLFNVIPAF